MIARLSSSLLLCLFAVALNGCGPSAQQIADQQARQRFREAVAAMKICTQGSTYPEFREKRLALETCYTANQSALPIESIQFSKFTAIMRACDSLWTIADQRESDALRFVFPEERSTEIAEAMNAIKEASGYSWIQMGETKDASADKELQTELETMQASQVKYLGMLKSEEALIQHIDDYYHAAPRAASEQGAQSANEQAQAFKPAKAQFDVSSDHQTPFPRNYVQVGLALISQQCDTFLK